MVSTEEGGGSGMGWSVAEAGEVHEKCCYMALWYVQ